MHKTEEIQLKNYICYPIEISSDTLGDNKNFIKVTMQIDLGFNIFTRKTVHLLVEDDIFISDLELANIAKNNISAKILNKGAILAISNFEPLVGAILFSEDNENWENIAKYILNNKAPTTETNSTELEV